MATAAVHDAHAAHPTGWKRYVYATNHKDIGTMYLIFAIIAGIIGGSLSIAMRIELQEPGIQIFHGLAQMVYGVSADESAGNHLTLGIQDFEARSQRFGKRLVEARGILGIEEGAATGV